MSLRDRELQHKKRLQNVSWLIITFILISVLLYEWQQVQKNAKLLQFDLTRNNLYQGAVNLRQNWELNNRPHYDKVGDIAFEYTQLGWPIVLKQGELDCPKIWSLLSNGIGMPEYNSFSYVNADDSNSYNTCLYDIGIKKKLAIFYINDKIHIATNLSQ
ncbi:hypothetical protein [Photobacterium angustum]|uniref:MSHA biogenesis protein MshF n=1 Tax=Photobacterium angustum TaxID=661 RepID=A0A855SCY2_PHOAN|nr:hypothetical protein [Photobacterium angustum]KJF81125.1 hypothetical protein UB36_13360 [Photobacterium damselae subsp. damselae]KJG39273.1 hypothetical protein UA35_13965 [Photobacterium angustum]KJG44637.1 hypothetical protein UA31_13365 [Photobacterium angustum]KJG48308.1 hypothetical protein UA30_13760 [Photobacterium angustum]KJG52038.1 hypothetical protein UA34_15390 [Photobacterium angustum]